MTAYLLNWTSLTGAFLRTITVPCARKRSNHPHTDSFNAPWPFTPILLMPLGQSCFVCSSLAIRTSYMAQISIESLLTECILRNKDLHQDNMFFLQTVFTTLWTIWLQRNKVVHDGKRHDPMEIILTTKCLNRTSPLQRTLESTQPAEPLQK